MSTHYSLFLMGSHEAFIDRYSKIPHKVDEVFAYFTSSTNLRTRIPICASPRVKLFRVLLLRDLIR